MQYPPICEDMASLAQTAPIRAVRGLGVKVRCSVCGVVKCRLDLLRAHIRSSESCGLAYVDTIHGPEGRLLVPRVPITSSDISSSYVF